MVKIIYCIVKVESRECEILKTAFKKEGAMTLSRRGDGALPAQSVVVIVCVLVSGMPTQGSQF